MEKLKPCPMCGKTDLDMLVDIVQCHECGLTIAKDTEEEAIAAWNTRPIEDKLRASGIEAMRKNEELRQQRGELARAILIVYGLADRKAMWCHWCENRRDNHAIDCAAAKAESYLQEDN